VFVGLLTALCLLSPLLAAVLLTYTELIGWEGTYAKQWIALEKLEMAVNELKVRVDNVEGNLGGPQSVAAGPREPQDPRGSRGYGGSSDPVWTRSESVRLRQSALA